MRQFLFFPPFQSRCLTLLITCLLSGLSQAQTPCDHAILGPYFALNSVCGQNNGAIFLTTIGGDSLYTFAWTPNVSDNAQANALFAGSYRIKIARKSDPACFIDTLIIVNNSDGPQVDVNIQPSDTANCTDSNGKLSLVPADPNANLSFTWSTGATGPTLSGIKTGSYTVTITNNSTGCFGIKSVYMPNRNLLTLTPLVEKYPKCGKPIGKVNIQVNGGSGLYTYNGGNSPVFSNLAAGNYQFKVLDQQTGCERALLVSLSDKEVNGDLQIVPHGSLCPLNAINSDKQKKGYVEFQLSPGANFSLPFSAIITNGNGLQFQPNELPKGLYELQISDSDGCNLPLKSFYISQPDPFSFTSLPDIQPETNTQLGSITLELEGGSPAYRFDWNDIPGTDNPQNRLNLNSGIYQGILYDTFQCAFPIGPFTIAAQNPKIDTIHLFVQSGATEPGIYCPAPTPGVGLNGATYTLLNGTFSGYSNQGSWTLQPGDGCLSYFPTGSPGGPSDYIFIRQSVTGNMALDITYCVKVTILAYPASFENVYFTLPGGQSGLACGHVPASFTGYTIVPMGNNPLAGSLGPYGQYLIDPQNACIEFDAANVPGHNVDKICIGVYAPQLNRAHIICYWPSIQSSGSCNADLIPEDSIQRQIVDCTQPEQLCIPIPYEEITDYIILDNDLNYADAILPCIIDSLWTYRLENYPLIGPYTLHKWDLNGNILSGTFENLQDLVLLLNQLDPGGQWELESGFLLVGGKAQQSYGVLELKNNFGAAFSAIPKRDRFLARGTALQLYNGNHKLKIYNLENACSDSLFVQVQCTGCPSFHTYIPDSLGVIHLSADSCSSPYPFCTNIPLNQVSGYTFSIDQTVANNWTACGSLTALLVDTGIHQIHILDGATHCTQDIQVDLKCIPQGLGELMANPDNYYKALSDAIDLPILLNDLVFGKYGNKSGLSSVNLVTLPQSGGVEYIPALGVYRYKPESGCGQDSFSYRIIDTIGRASFTTVFIKIFCDKLFVFNGISPNGDNRNDYWHIIGIENFPGNEVSVFNRWGGLVFQQSAYTNDPGWDGQFNGKPLPDGVYFYVIDLGNGEPTVKGTLQIMR